MSELPALINDRKPYIQEAWKKSESDPRVCRGKGYHGRITDRYRKNIGIFTAIA